VHLRLRQLYEASLRYWGQIELSSSGTPGRLASEIRERAYVERNQAHERLLAHGRTCSICNPKAPTGRKTSRQDAL
jgi:hypothetical protein